MPRIFQWATIIKRYNCLGYILVDKRGNSSHPSYESYIVKRIFDTSDKINEVWVHTDDKYVNTHTITNFSYKNHKESGLIDAPNDIKTFLNTDWVNMSDNYYNREEGVCESGGLYDPRVMMKHLLNEYLGDRLKEVKISEYVIGRLQLQIYVKDLPGNGSTVELYKELGKLFSLVPGRMKNVYWDYVDGVRVIYVNDKGEQLLEIGMGTRFDSWIKNDLDIVNINDYTDYDLPPLSDKEKEELQQLTKKEDINHDLNYTEIMTKLKSIEGVQVAHLGYDGDKLNLVFKMDGGTDKEVFTKQMEITDEVMKLPIDSVWFISEGEDINRVTNIDRKQYNVLTYLKGYRDVEIKTTEWPIVVSAYWQNERSEDNKDMNRNQAISGQTNITFRTDKKTNPR